MGTVPSDTGPHDSGPPDSGPLRSGPGTGQAVVPLSAEHRTVVARMVESYAGSAPAGWVRIVLRKECSVAPELAGAAGVQAVVLRRPDGLVQEHFRVPREHHFLIGDMLRELAAASPTRTVVLELVVDATGDHVVRIVQDVPRLLVGVRDETSSVPVHRYLERHRAELEALDQRLAPG